MDNLAVSTAGFLPEGTVPFKNEDTLALLRDFRGYGQAYNPGSNDYYINFDDHYLCLLESTQLHLANEDSTDS